MPASRMHELAELCEPGVTVIAIGDRNDIGLYRDLVQAGVNEYIVKPVTAQLLAKALLAAPASAGREPIIRKLGKVVAAIGARGGVGTTTLAINLAWHLANRQNRRVLLLDLDLQNGDNCPLPERSTNSRVAGGAHQPASRRRRVPRSGRGASRRAPLRAQRRRAPAGRHGIQCRSGRDAGRSAAHAIPLRDSRCPAGFPFRLISGRSMSPTSGSSLPTRRCARCAIRYGCATPLGKERERTAISSWLIAAAKAGLAHSRLEEMSRVKVSPNFVIPFRPKLLTASRSRSAAHLLRPLRLLLRRFPGECPSEFHGGGSRHDDDQPGAAFD